MIKTLLPFSILLLLGLPSGAQDKTAQSKSADAVLTRLHQKLSGLKNILYKSSRELNYASEDYRSTSLWLVYLEFSNDGTANRFKYQIDDLASKQIFNGTEKFDLDKRKKTMVVADHPDQKSVSNISALYNSVLTLKHILPLLINDTAATKNLTDTSVNGSRCIAVRINIGKRRIQNSGEGFDAMTTKSNFIYTICVDKKSLLPVAIIQQNDLNTDFIKTVFAGMETNTLEPLETSWYYSTYSKDFKPAADMPVPTLLAVGSVAPSWKLQLYNADKTLSSDEFKGEVVLIDFWIKNCSPCIQSVPHLNALQEKFKGRSFKIISINLYDTKAEVNWFCDKHKSAYPVLLNGKTVAEKYGVSGFPTFFVIDKAGKIIYAGSGFDASVQSAVEQVILKAL